MKIGCRVLDSGHSAVQPQYVRPFTSTMNARGVFEKRCLCEWKKVYTDGVSCAVCGHPAVLAVMPVSLTTSVNAQGVFVKGCVERRL